MPRDGNLQLDGAAGLDASDRGAPVQSVMILHERGWQWRDATTAPSTSPVWTAAPNCRLVDQHTSPSYARPRTARPVLRLYEDSAHGPKALTSRGTIVASVELEDYNDRFKRFMSRPNHLDYKLKALEELYTTAKCSFGFGGLGTGA